MKSLGKVTGGDGGDRTPGLSIANAALSQLSYIPRCDDVFIRRRAVLYANSLNVSTSTPHKQNIFLSLQNIFLSLRKPSVNGSQRTGARM